MSSHKGVSCDSCMTSNFTAKRFKCLICFDYDLCESCYVAKVETSNHLASHPMQCILTRKEFGWFYRGETISPETPPALVCPFCGSLGFTEVLLQEHISKEHTDGNASVICPLCAAMPSGDPNFVTNNLLQHLTVDHRLSQQENDDYANRHFRRRTIRARNHRSSLSSGSGSAVSSSNNNATQSPAVRDPIDPIAELLSQLSGVRRSAQELRDLQAQLQVERDKVVDVKQQLERFPNLKSQPNTSVALTQQPAAGQSGVTKTVGSGSKKPPKDEDDDSRLDNLVLTDNEKLDREKEDIERSHFVQELLLSMLATDNTAPDQQENGLEKAVPTQCLALSTSIIDSVQPTSSSESKKTHKSDCVGKDGKKRQRQKASSKAQHHSPSTQSDSSSQRSQPSNRTETTLVLQPPAGIPVRNSHSADSNVYNSGEEDEKVSDDDNRPPSPRIRLQNHLFSAVRLPSVQNTAPIAHYGNEDVSSPVDNIAKHIH